LLTGDNDAFVLRIDVCPLCSPSTKPSQINSEGAHAKSQMDFTKYWAEEARDKKVHTLNLYLYDVEKQDSSMVIDLRIVVTYGEIGSLGASRFLAVFCFLV
jgi:hypothetical protein